MTANYGYTLNLCLLKVLASDILVPGSGPPHGKHGALLDQVKHSCTVIILSCSSLGNVRIFVPLMKFPAKLGFK